MISNTIYEMFVPLALGE